MTFKTDEMGRIPGVHGPREQPVTENNDVLTDAEWLRTVAEDVSRYEEDAQRLRRIADRLEAQSTERELVEAK